MTARGGKAANATGRGWRYFPLGFQTSIRRPASGLSFLQVNELVPWKLCAAKPTFPPSQSSGAFAAAAPTVDVAPAAE
jgi:hypothetical protein